MTFTGIVLMVGAAIFGYFAGSRVAGRRRRQAPIAASASGSPTFSAMPGSTPASPHHAGAGGAGARSHDALLRQVLEVRDHLRNRDDPLTTRLDAGLVGSGFELIDPSSGEPFDPALHTVVDTVPADAEHPADTIAVVEHVGLRDGEVVFRRAEVVVGKEQP